MTRQAGKQAEGEVWLDEMTGAGEGIVKKAPEHRMRYDSHGSKGPGVYCTCGSKKIHRRGKPLAAWAKRHFEKTGHKWQGQS